MNPKCYRALLIIVVLSFILTLPTESFSINPSNYEKVFTFRIGINNIEPAHKLYISIPPSLYEYYQKQNHMANVEYFSKFVTPNIFGSIAQNIRTVTENKQYEDELFANAVLDIVHQIPYNKTHVKYPVETIVDNFGDCDALSVLTASVMEAGGLDVVLLYYKDDPVSHMNIGVYLREETNYFVSPKDSFYYEYNGKKYYTAETTGNDWRVGEQPQNYIDSQPKIVPIENEEAKHIEISSCLEPLTPSSISLSLIPESLNIQQEGTNITVQGSIVPSYSNQKVTITINHETNQFNFQKTTFTDQFGNYGLTLNLNKTGSFTIQASWGGLQNYAGSDSDTLTLNIGLNQLLDEYEINDNDLVDSSNSMPRLNSIGSMILNNHPIKEILKKNFTGTDFLLRNEFIILGSDEPFLTEQTITIPEYNQIVVRRGKIITRQVPEQTFTVTNYKHWLDNHIEVSFVMNSQDDYSLNVRLLDNSDIAQVSNRSDTKLINASSYVKENIWYYFIIDVSDNQISVDLFDENNLHLATIDPSANQNEEIKEIKLIMKYDPDSIIVLKNPQTHIIDHTDGLIEENKSSSVEPKINENGEPITPEEPPTSQKKERLKPEIFSQETVFLTLFILAILTVTSFIFLILYIQYNKSKQ